MNELAAWTEFLTRTLGDTPDRQVAAKLDVSPSTIGRWRTGAIFPKPKQVVEFARAYGIHPLIALKSAGYLDVEELNIAMGNAPSPKVWALREFENTELIEELARRLHTLSELAEGN